MSGDVMMFPDTVEEFMEQYKVVDREQVYSNGIEFVPIFRMQQWFDHVKHSPDDVRPVGKWLPHPDERVIETEICSVCGIGTKKMYHCTDGMQIWVEEPSFQYCPYCGAKMKGE